MTIVHYIIHFCLILRINLIMWLVGGNFTLSLYAHICAYTWRARTCCLSWCHAVTTHINKSLSNQLSPWVQSRVQSPAFAPTHGHVQVQPSITLDLESTLPAQEIYHQPHAADWRYYQAMLFNRVLVFLVFSLYLTSTGNAGIYAIRSPVDRHVCICSLCTVRKETLHVVRLA